MLLPFCPSLVALSAIVLAAVAVLAQVLCLDLVGPPDLESMDLGFLVLDPGHLFWRDAPLTRLRRCYEWCA